MIRFYRLISEALEATKPNGGKVEQVDLAKRLRCTQPAIVGYRLGRSLPPQTRVPHYARVLRVSPQQLAAIVAADRAVTPRKRLIREAAAWHRDRETFAAAS